MSTFAILFMVAGITVGSLAVLTIIAIFSLKYFQARGRGNRQRQEAAINQVLTNYEKGGKEGKEAERALSRWSLPMLLMALNVAKGNFKESTAQEVLDILKERKADQQLATELLTRRRKWRRIEAAYALANFGDPSIPYLAKAVNSDDIDVSFNSAQALSLIRNEKSFSILLHKLPELRAYSRARIASLLDRYIDMGFEVLKSTASHPNAEVRYWVAYLLGNSKNNDALPYLLKLSEDEVDSVRASAAKGLGALGLTEAANRLVALLDDPWWIVRNDALKSLKELNISAAAGKIATLLRDHNWWVRENASEALFGFRDKSLPILIEMLEDEDRFARNRASEILERIGFVDSEIDHLEREPQNAQVFDLLKKIHQAGARRVFEKHLDTENETLKQQLKEVLAS